MALSTGKIKILFFIGSLRSGGKERRLIELLSYLKKQGRYQMLVVMTKSDIHYQEFYELDIPYVIATRKWKKNVLSVFHHFYRIAAQFQPHLIHTWGRMQTLYTLPTAIARDVPVINSQITGAPARLPQWSLLSIIDKLNFHYSKSILANSKAGIDSYEPPKAKRKVIYNGISMSRFQNLPTAHSIKDKYAIQTPYAVIMVGSFTPYKDYDLFLRVARLVTSQREDTTFLGVGGYDKENDAAYRRMLALSADEPRILFPGKINDVEALVNACDIGVLFSPNGEGISNAILEYMALSKPVIATDTGGTKELIVHNKNGYLVPVEAVAEDVSEIIVHLLENAEERIAFGRANRKIIDETFSLDKMGEGFEQIYDEALAQNLPQPEKAFYRLNPS